MISRRDFAGLAAGAALGWPLAAPAQTRDGMRLGVLMGLLASDPNGQAYAAALVQGLGALNWHEGANLRVDWRWAGSDPALYERYAAELVARAPDVLLAMGSPSVEALRRQTSTISVVFTVVTDPVGQGFVGSLARPGGTVTGFSNYDPPMAGKWLGMLTQIAPPAARVAVRNGALCGSVSACPHGSGPAPRRGGAADAGQ
jgi:putative ABC transport system substrate-binding protein